MHAPTSTEPLLPLRVGKKIIDVRGRLLRWFRRHKRDLPWRSSRDPYAIWVSEIMLQQTRVDSVIPYYQAFMRQYPTLESLAQAPIEQVMHSWAGLGYYSRVRNLQRAAQIIGSRHHGVFPSDPSAILALPGIGPYTEGAISSIAFQLPRGIVDGNIRRVFARLFDITGNMEDRDVLNYIWKLANTWARTRSSGNANEALMELGALICTRSSPKCEICPARTNCAAFASGKQLELPKPRKRRKSLKVRMCAVLVRRSGKILLVRRDSGNFLRGWWEVPTMLNPSKLAPRPPGLLPPKEATRQQERICSKLEHALHLRAKNLTQHLSVQHKVLHHSLDIEVWSTSRCGLPENEQAISEAAKTKSPTTVLPNLDLHTREARWFTGDQCRGLALSTLSGKVLQVATRDHSAWSKYLENHQRKTQPS